MQYIYEVYRRKSISKAAERLGLTQPTLSMAIKRVEKELQLPLFDRTQNPIQLTDAGKIYIEKAEQILKIETSLRSELDNLRNLRSGNVRIGGTNYQISYFISPVVAHFAQKFPGIHVELFEDRTVHTLEYLEKGDIDMTVVSEDTDTSSFIRIPAFRDTILLAVPRSFVSSKALAHAFTRDEILSGSYKTSGKPPVDLKLFEEVPFILSHPKNSMYRLSMQLFDEAGIKPHVVLEMDQFVTSYYMCCRDIGAAFVSSAVVSDRSRRNTLYFVIDSPHAVRPFYLAISKNQYMSVAAKAFIRVLEEFYPDDR